MTDSSCTAIVSQKASGLSGTVRVPSDKSISHRALIFSSIAHGQSTLHHLLLSEDCLATLRILQACGVEIDLQGDDAVVQGVGLFGLSQPASALYCGNSGTSMRLLAGLFAGQRFSVELVGDESLMQRPMRRIADPLKQMGASITLSEQDTAPLCIQPSAALQGIHYNMPMASAQVKSCLLLAGLYAKGETVITEPGITRDHSEKMLQAFGYSVEVQENSVRLQAGGTLTGCEISIPADISSAAFYLVAGTITPNSELTLKSVGINATRLGIIHLLQMMGADIRLENQREYGTEPVADVVVHSASLKGITIPKEQVALAIDELPVLMIAAACAEGKTYLRHASELRVKESDRIKAMVNGLRAVGVLVEELEDGMVVSGGEIYGGEVDSQGDHRIAMSFIIAGCVAKAPITVRDCENINTSFPGFVELSRSVGLCCEAC